MSDYEQSITTLPTEPAVYALEHPTVEHDPAVVRDRYRSQRNLHRYGMFVLGMERVLRGTGTEDVRREVIAAIVTVLLRAYAGNPVAVDGRRGSTIRQPYSGFRREPGAEVVFRERRSTTPRVPQWC